MALIINEQKYSGCEEIVRYYVPKDSNCAFPSREKRRDLVIVSTISTAVITTTIVAATSGDVVVLLVLGLHFKVVYFVDQHQSRKPLIGPDNIAAIAYHQAWQMPLVSPG